MMDYDTLEADIREQNPDRNEETIQHILEFFRQMAEDKITKSNERISFEYVEIYPEDLKPHPVNVGLYDGLIDADNSLIDSILQRGLVEPLIINSKNEILSGYRRWLALLKINKDKRFPKTSAFSQIEEIFIRWKARCLVATFRDEKDEKLAIIEYNKRRPKRCYQLYKESELLENIYGIEMRCSIHSERNSPIGRSYSNVQKLARRIKNSPGEISDRVDSSLTDEEIVEKLGYLIGADEEEDEKRIRDESKWIRKQIMEELKIDKNNFYKLKKLGRSADNGNKNAIKLIQLIDNGKLSINGAYIIFWLIQQQNDDAVALAQRAAADALKKEKNDILTPTMALKEYNKMHPKPPKVSKRIVFLDSNGNRITKKTYIKNNPKQPARTITPFKPLTDEQKAEIDRKEAEETSKRIAENNKRLQELDSNPSSPAARGRW